MMSNVNLEKFSSRFLPNYLERYSAVNVKRISDCTLAGLPTRLRMEITLIAAMSEDGFIARDGRIPWHLPRDIQHFREYCAGKTLLIGRKTFEQMNGWFQDHFPIVVTRRAGYAADPGRAVATLDGAVELARGRGVDELVVLGGGEIFAATAGRADRLVLTTVQTKLGGGTPFPVQEFSGWKEICAQIFPPDNTHAFGFTIQHLSNPNPNHHHHAT